MSSSALRIKPEEIDNAEKRGKYTVSIIGCGQIGVLHACLFAEGGFKVICVDEDQTIVNSLSKGKTAFLEREVELKLKNYTRTGRLNSTNDLGAAVSQGDIVAITISVKLDGKKKADYSEIESICKRVGLSLRRGSLVILLGITGLGITEGLIREVLENTSGLKVGADFGLACSPIRVLAELTFETLANHKRIVAASDKDSLNAASAVLETISKNGVKRIDSTKMAEVVTLLETVQQDVIIALADEFALFCEKVGVDYLEAHEIAEAGGQSTLSLPTLSQENTREKPYLLLEDTENLNLRLRIPKIAREINEEASKHAINLIKDVLRTCGKTLRRARISLLGISQVPNMKSPPKTIARKLAELLEARGAKVRLYDPYISGDELAELRYPISKNLTEAVEGVDCILIITGHDHFKRLNLRKLKVTMRMPAAIVDLEGIVEPDKVEKEGIAYRGLGRGVWTK